MMTFKFGRRALVAGAVAALSFGAPAFADGHKVLDSIHFLIPGGAGGGGTGGEGAVAATPGETNTGGGGGGTASNNLGKPGGSGIVIIRYKFQ